MPRATKNKEYISYGLTISPSVPSVGDKVKIIYDGLLAKNGATHVFAHVGFGSRWEHVDDYRMDKTTTGFETTVPVISGDTINLCFKDCAENWDNNTGKNYSFDISQ